MSKPLRALWWAMGLSVMAALAGCGSPAVPAVEAERELHRSLGGEPGTLDPQLAGDTYAYEVLRDAYEGLMTEDAAGRLVPGQAKGWVVSADGREYRFALRAGLRWSDGKPLVAGDFVRGLQRAVDPATASPNAPLLRVLAGAGDIMAGRLPVDRLGVSAPDEAHVVVRLEHPADFLPALLAHPVAFPYRPGPTVFNGAYRLESWLPGYPIHAVANGFYRAASQVNIKRVSYQGIADENIELLRYRGGTVDVTGGLPADAIAWAREHLPGQVQLAPQAAVFFLGFNLRKGNLRSSPLGRRALAMAIDRERLTHEVLRAGQVAAYGLVPPGFPGYAGPVVSWAEWSREQKLQQARADYAAAGFGATRPLHVRVLYNRNTTVRRAVLAIALMWREVLGADVELVDEEFGRFLERRTQPEGWEVVRLGWNADYADPASFLEIFRSGSSDNSVGFSVPRYDAELAKAMETAGDERFAALAAGEAELLNADAIAPVYFLATRRLVRPTVVTGPPNLMNHNYTRYWRWAAPEPPRPPSPRRATAAVS